MQASLVSRPRRNRKMGAIRQLVQETHLVSSQLIAPLFILEGTKRKEELEMMPGVFRYSIDCALKEVKELYALGIRAIDLFAVICDEKKCSEGREAVNEQGLLFQAIREIKHCCPEMCVMADIALDPFTDHGHDGLINDNYEIVNDATVSQLSEMSLLAAQAGVDVVAPSDMMDGRVGSIRNALDQEGFTNVSILSYAAKYASSLYGPFREAVGSSLAFGDKRTYQMSPENRREAIREALLDEKEGADLLLIKPALLYLDILSDVKQHTHLPVGAYHVSGEYAMVMAAAEKGWLDASKVFYESLLSIKRAGADFILTYAAKQIATQLART